MIYLTFDTDHMDESRMVQFLETISFPGRGTFFCTQTYTSLSASNHELAPHPCLEPQNDWDEELQRMRGFFPKAKGWRAHSCVFSHILAIWLSENGYKYVSTHDNFGAKDIQPHQHMWGIWHFPIYYMDNMDISQHRFWSTNKSKPFSRDLITNAIEGDGTYIFDFHPIHLLLNTPNLEFYFEKRDTFKKGEDLKNLGFSGYGVRTFFTELCQEMKKKGLKSGTLENLLFDVEQRMQFNHAA